VNEIVGTKFRRLARLSEQVLSLRVSSHHKERGRDMKEERKEKPATVIKGMFHDAVGLPPGDGTPHGEGRPAWRDGTPVDRNSGADE
jgi:hypothetical protein